MANRVAIVGIGQTDHRARRPDVSEPELVNEAVTAALEDADMTLGQVESVFVANMDGFEGVYLSDHWMVDGAGSFLKPGFKVTTGGSTGASCTSAAFHMVASGLFDTALAVGYQKHDEGNPTAGLNCCGAPGWVREMMDGVMGGFANAAMIYMEKTGAREEHAAMVRLKADRGACANPHAQIRLGLTSVDEVMRSRMLVWPLRLLDMCPASCGACALVLASEEQAKKITDRPVWIADMVTAHQEPTPGWLISETDELVAPQVAAKKIYARNGITNPRREIDMAEIYEAATWHEMILYENLFFCEKGEGWKLIERGVTAIDGEFPVNPSGGVQSANPIGATGMLRIAEAALQVRGDAGEHQVPKKVDTALANATGGHNWTVMTLLRSTLS